jgi:hypothetical protein
MPNHNQNDLPAPKKDYYCGPVAAWNSIEWLYGQYPKAFVPGYALPADWRDGATELAGYMKTDTNKGTWLSDFIDGKNQFFKKHGVAGGWSVVSRNGEYDPVSKTWGVDPPDWKWIRKEIDDGEDVELYLRRPGWAHWVSVDPGKGTLDDNPFAAVALTIAGYIWNDVNGNDLLDSSDTLELEVGDPHAELPAGTPYPRVPVSVATSGDYQALAMKTTYGGNEVWITGAVAESPVPEPATLVLFASSVAPLAVLLRRRRTRP